MGDGAWRDKRERQYEHIKEGLLGRGTGEAKRRGIKGRSRMNKAQLERELDR